MTQMDFINGLEALRLNVEAYLQAVPVNYPQFNISRITGDRGVLVPMISSNNWSSISSYCESQMTAQARKLAGMESEQNQINALLSGLGNLKSGFTSYYSAPRSNATWLSYRAGIASDLANQGMAQLDIDAFLDNLSNKGGLNGFKLYLANLNELCKTLNYGFERNLAQYIYYYHAKVSADYTLAAATPQTLPFNLTSSLYYLRSSLKDKNEALYQKIRNGDIAGAIDACNRYSDWVDTKMQTHIIPLLAYTYQQRQSPTSNFTTDGRRAMKSGELCQMAITGKTSFVWLKWYLQWNEEENKHKDILGKASNLTNATIPVAGDTVSVADLFNNPNSRDNEDVVIQGKLNNLEITHLTATKVISTATVENSASVAIKLVLPHIKMDSGGLVNNAYLKISGKFQAVNPEASGQPAVSIERLGLTDLGESNWSAWVRAQLRTIYTPVAHNLETNFSLEPGEDGAINPVKYGVTNSKTKSLKINNKIF